MNFPGLTFDNYRCPPGYGGGYYDSLLLDHPNASKVGLFDSFQEVQEAPREACDLKLDQEVVSDL